MAIASLVVRSGIGSWGDIAHIITHGLDIGSGPIGPWTDNSGPSSNWTPNSATSTVWVDNAAASTTWTNN